MSYNYLNDICSFVFFLKGVRYILYSLSLYIILKVIQFSYKYFISDKNILCTTIIVYCQMLMFHSCFTYVIFIIVCLVIAHVAKINCLIRHEINVLVFCITLPY